MRSFLLSLGVIFAAGATGTLMPFLEFFHTNLSPIQAMMRYDGIWRLVLPAFLSFPVFAAYLIWKVRGRVSRSGASMLYVLSAASASLIIWNIASMIKESGPAASFAAFGAVTCLGAGAVLLIKNLMSGNAHPLHPVIALQVCYVSHVVFCITLFMYPGMFGFTHLSLVGWGPGGYLALTTIVVYAGQISTAMKDS